MADGPHLPAKYLLSEANLDHGAQAIFALGAMDCAKPAHRRRIAHEILNAARLPPRPRKADPAVVRAIDALTWIETACRRLTDPIPAVLEIASDALAELRDSATGQPWHDDGLREGESS